MEDRDNVQKVYEDLLAKPRQVHSIFSDYFGEDRVSLEDIPLLADVGRAVKRITVTRANYTLEDIQAMIPETTPSILVHFPRLRVTNEHDKFIDIMNLWVRVDISYDGTIQGTFLICKSTYSKAEWIGAYVHSHVPGLNRNRPELFRSPCLGTGPIRGTIANLIRYFDEDIWQLFCFELDKYVHTESIAGTPYINLESINSRNTDMVIGDYVMQHRQGLPQTDLQKMVIKRFAESLIREKKLRFNYTNGSYGIAMSYVDLTILISNEFIKWYNDTYKTTVPPFTLEQLKDRNILKTAIIRNGAILYLSNTDISTYDWTNIRGKRLFKFKGQDITLNIVGGTSEDFVNASNFLNYMYIDKIVERVLATINYKYGKPVNTTTPTSGGEEEAPRIIERSYII